MIKRRSLLGAALAAPAILRATDALSCACFSGTGPPASSAFLTADFTSVYSYPTPGTTTQDPSRGQMVISPRLYGSMDGAFANDGSNVGSFNVTNGNPFSLLTSTDYQTKMAKINPGIWMELTPPNPGIWTLPLPSNTSTLPTLAPNAFTNLINNFYKVDPLGVSGIILNQNWQRESNLPINETQYGQMMHIMATFFQNQVMPNGCRCPVIGFTGQNEPDNGEDLIGHYNQIVSNVKNVALPGGGTYLVSGPVPNFASNVTNGWANFTQNVSGMDIFEWDNFFEGGPFDPINNPSGWPPGGRTMQYLQTTVADYFAGGIRQTATTVAYQPLAYWPAGNMDSDASNADPAAADYRGAMWDAIQKITSANSSPVTAYWAKWDSALQGNIGFLVNDGSNRISPAGYANGQQVRTITGPRWNVPTNAANLLTMAVSPAAGRFGLMIVNAGQGAQNNKQIALSHWPVNSTGNASGASAVNTWQLTNTTTADGTPGTLNVTAGLTAPFSFPDPSVTIFYV